MTSTQRVWEFDRYVDGQLKAEGIRISKATTQEQAFRKAVCMASPGSVLVLRSATPRQQAFADLVSDLVACAISESSRPTSMAASVKTMGAKQRVLDAFKECNASATPLDMSGQPMGDPHPCDLTRAGCDPITGSRVETPDELLQVGQLVDCQDGLGTIFAEWEELRYKLPPGTKLYIKARRMGYDCPACKRQIVFGDSVCPVTKIPHEPPQVKTGCSES